MVKLGYEPRSPDDFPNWRFEHLDLDYDAQTQSVWMCYKADSSMHFPLSMFEEIVVVRESLRKLFFSGARYPIRYFVIASKRPEVFSLGGDLAAFAASVRRGDREILRAHANICVDIVRSLTMAFDLPIVTLSAVHGQCLGGGFEGALATDFLIAERSAKLGLPEMAFNTFPGMGAVSLLSRRVGAAQADEIISGGGIYSGERMHELGVVDVVAPDGGAHKAARDWMLDGGEEGWRVRRVITEARRLCFPVSRDELSQIVDVWIDCVFALSDHDLRHMERLSTAQKRLFARKRGQPSDAHISAEELGRKTEARL
jgi:DSF synthase